MDDWNKYIYRKAFQFFKILSTHSSIDCQTGYLSGYDFKHMMLKVGGVFFWKLFFSTKKKQFFIFYDIYGFKSCVIMNLLPLSRAMFVEPFRYLQRYFKIPRKISQSLSKWSFLQNFTLTENFKLLRSRPNSDFKVSRILLMFASISENESFILSCFWWHCRELLTSNLSDR